MWLAQERDWLDEEIALARGRRGLEPGDAADSGETLAIRFPDAERLHRGLSRAIALIDTLSVDPSRISERDTAHLPAALTPWLP